MKVLRGVGLAAAGALLWAATLYLYGRFPVPFPASLFAQVLALGLPAFAVAPLAHRFRLPQPLLWTAVSFSLGWAIHTALVVDASLARRLEILLVQTVTFTIAQPVLPAGYTWRFPLALAIAVIVGSYALEAFRARPPGTPKAGGR